MSVTVYSSTRCNFCTIAKTLLNNYNIEFEEKVIGEDVGFDDFRNQYPDVKMVPFIVFNDKQITGSDNLKVYLENEL